MEFSRFGISFRRNGEPFIRPFGNQKMFWRLNYPCQLAKYFRESGHFKSSISITALTSAYFSPGFTDDSGNPSGGQVSHGYKTPSPMRNSFPLGLIAIAGPVAERLIVHPSGSFGASLFPHTILIPFTFVFMFSTPQFLSVQLKQFF